MTRVLVTGVDPGLVHTGVVSMLFEPDAVRVRVMPAVVLGPDAGAVDTQIEGIQIAYDVPQRDVFTFIEDYNPRSHFGTDSKMTKAVHEIKAAVPGSKVLSNTGVKKVVKRDLMDLLEVWKFPTVTNHQDLRSAAYIALYGMLKDDNLNELLTQVVHDHLAGETWNVLAR